MQVIPKVRHLKSDARKLKNCLGITLSQAQEQIAYMYGSKDWKSLKTQSYLHGKTLFVDQRLSELDELILLINPFLDILKQSNDLALKFENSLLYKIVSGDYNKIHQSQVRSLLYGKDEWCVDREFIENLEYSEYIQDSLMHYIRRADDTVAAFFSKRKCNNLHLRDYVFGQHLYAYRLQKGNKVYFDIREWDYCVNHPSIKGNQELKDGNGIESDICTASRSWFFKSQIGYLKYLSHQYKALGFQVTFRLNFFNGCSFYDAINRRSECYFYKESVRKLGIKFLSCGGRLIHGPLGRGGIEISFDNPSYGAESLIANYR